MKNIIGKGNSRIYYYGFSWGYYYFSAGYLFCKNKYRSFFNELYKYKSFSENTLYA